MQNSDAIYKSALISSNQKAVSGQYLNTDKVQTLRVESAHREKPIRYKEHAKSRKIFPRDHLNNHEKDKSLAAYRHGIQISDTSGDIGRRSTTVLRFLDLHRRSTRKDPRLNAKKLSDADIRGIIRRARTGLRSALFRDPEEHAIESIWWLCPADTARLTGTSIVQNESGSGANCRALQKSSDLSTS